jgi:uncharacterized damage-inducible protein DinB
MKNRAVALAALSGALLAASAAAQPRWPPPEPDAASAALRLFYEQGKDTVLRAAAKMPAESYGFRPTPEVRTFGELVAHVADGGYLFCARLKDEAIPLEPGAIERTKTSRAELIAALEASFAYCDPVFAALTDERLNGRLRFFQQETMTSVPAMLVVLHLVEHYGNMVTYLRLQGIVPPTSEAPPAPAADGAGN